MFHHRFCVSDGRQCRGVLLLLLLLLLLIIIIITTVLYFAEKTKTAATYQTTNMHNMHVVMSLHVKWNERNERSRIRASDCPITEAGALEPVSEPSEMLKEKSEGVEKTTWVWVFRKRSNDGLFRLVARRRSNHK